MRAAPAGPSRRPRAAFAAAVVAACALPAVADARPEATGPSPVDVGAAVAAPSTDPRVVAIVDATAAPAGDPEVAALAARLEAQLDREVALVPVEPESRTALVGPVPDRHAASRAQAQAALARAEDAQAALAYRAAVTAAEGGLAVAVDLPAEVSATRLVADLAFARGLARMLDGDRAGGAADFALVHRLDADRVLDAARYFPEVLDAFAAAAAGAAPAATLEVVAPDGAEVWVDGVAVGVAPVQVVVAFGLHVVTVVGDAVAPAGRLVDVSSVGARVVLEPADASRTDRLHRARQRLAAAVEPVARAEAVAALVRLAGAQDALVVGRGADGALAVARFSGRTGEMAASRPAAERDAVGWVAPLRPVVPAPPSPPPVAPLPEVPPPPSEVPWFERRWVQVSIGGGIVAGLVAAAVVAATRDPGSSPASPMVVVR